MHKIALFFIVFTLSVIVNAQTIKGDMNGDGVITMQDANAVVNTYLGKTAIQYLANVTPMYQIDNSPIVGTWFKTSHSYMILSSDGIIKDNVRSNVVKYEFMPVISKLLIYDIDGNPDRYYDVLKLDEKQLILGRNGDFECYTHEKPTNDETSDIVVSDELVSEESAEAVLNGIYTKFSSFMGYEIKMEKMAMNTTYPSSEELISANNTYITDAMREGYATINNCNYAIANLNAAGLKGHALAVRSIVYYMMTQLWGRLPYSLEPIVSSDYTIFVETEDNIVSDCIKYLSMSIDNLDVKIKSNGLLDKNTALALLIEMKLSNGTYNGEYSTSDLFSRTYDFILYQDGAPTYRVADEKYVDLLNGEYNLMQMTEIPNYRLENLSNSWHSDERYGVWNAMKRLGMAKPTMINRMSYRLKFPYPNEILKTTPGLWQYPEFATGSVTDIN